MADSEVSNACNIQPNSSSSHITNGMHNNPASHLATGDQGHFARKTPSTEDDTPRISPSTPPSVVQPPHVDVTEWRSWKLKWPWMIFLMLLEVGMISAIIYLQRRSTRGNGIVSVPQYSALTVSIGNISISKNLDFGLLWTTLPSLIMTLYGLMWATIVSGSADRQPFIDMRRQRDHAATAKITIMLDYRNYPSLYNWAKAFGNGHLLLGFAMSLAFIFSIAVVPLSSHLFVAAPSQALSKVSVNALTSFNESALTGSSSLQPAINLAAAIQIHGASPPPWMTEEYAFESFDIGQNGTIGNVTNNTMAYSAYLDCRTYSADESDAKYSTNEVTYQVNDRGCQVSGSITIINTTSVYVTTWSSTCSGSSYGRFGIVAAVYSDSSSIKLDDYSLVSCVASYWQTSGSVTVSVSPNTPPQLASFDVGSSSSFHPELYLIFENYLQYYTIFDPSNSIHADQFAFAVYSLAQLKNPESPISPELILNCTEDLFTTLYAALAVDLLLQPIPPTSTGDGILSVPVTRLYTVTAVTLSVVAILVLILLCNFCLFIYAGRKKSILVEEPVGLLGSAAILDQSDVPGLIARYKQQYPEEYKVASFIEDDHAVRDLKCYLDEGTRQLKLVNGDGHSATGV